MKVFTFHDSPRRAHSIAAQGGINAAKNYHNDGDSVYRLFYDTVKGGDFRSRESNVYRLAQVSVEHHRPVRGPGRALRPRVRRPARQPLLRRRPGEPHLLRPGPDRPAAAARRLPGARAAGVAGQRPPVHQDRDARRGGQVDGVAAGIVVRDLVTGEISSHSAHAVVLATGGYGNVFYLSTNAMNCNATAIWRAHKRGALFANPCFTQIHPTCIPSSDEFQSKLTLMSESLRNDGRIWVPKDPDDTRSPDQIPEAERDYFLERKYPTFGNLVPRDVASPQRQDAWSTRATASGRSRTRVYLDFADAIQRLGRERHPGALRQPVRHVRAHHRREPVQGADAHLPGHPLHDGRAVGRLRPDDHHPRPVRHRRGQLLRPRRQPPGRLGAHAGPGRRLLRAPLHHRQLPGRPARHASRCRTDAPGVHRRPRPSVRDDIDRWLSVRGTKSVDHYHRELGKIMWDYCGMARDEAGLEKALAEIPALRDEFERDVRVLGSARHRQPVAREGAAGRRLLRAGRADVPRRPAPRGELRRPLPGRAPDRRRARPSATTSTSPTWAPGSGRAPARPRQLHKEPLEFEYVHLTQRSYK